MNWINISVSIGLALLMVTFSFENMMPVHLSFLNFKSDEMPLFSPVVISFLLGFSSGLLALSFSRRKHKKEIKYLRKENALLNQEVENLRNIPLQDDL
ncbi:MAG: LapA family protein [Ghiorsea sp.]|nr:LapA family protein [Ghiorsea sp.]